MDWQLLVAGLLGLFLAVVIVLMIASIVLSGRISEDERRHRHE
jgi:hypothetical protein